MKSLKSIVVLYGGFGEEREVSLKSGEKVIDSLKLKHSVEAVCLDDRNIPDWIESESHIVFPMIHGAFGEDGELQNSLSERGIEFVGSNAVSSALCMDKILAKERVEALGIKTAESLFFDANTIPLADDIIQKLGSSLVLKPRDSGSSCGLSLIENRSSMGVALSKINSGNWMVERRLKGRELTIGLLDGQALEIVEIKYSKECYDYDTKYLSGSTEYLCPAELPDEITDRIQSEAEAIFKSCDCRDFARIDFILEGDTPYFLEVNTLPGMTPQSLLPKSAAAKGIDFNSLIETMISYGIKRFNAL
ncbi:MAG: D-alanine--D-alanine ligase family protein [Opitutales bacterium]